jgi:hypothetical protein
MRRAAVSLTRKTPPASEGKDREKSRPWMMVIPKVLTKSRSDQMFQAAKLSRSGRPSLLTTRELTTRPGTPPVNDASAMFGWVSRSRASA